MSGWVQTVWPDLAKFRHFGAILVVFEGLFNNWQNCEPTLATIYDIGRQKFIVLKGYELKQ